MECLQKRSVAQIWISVASTKNHGCRCYVLSATPLFQMQGKVVALQGAGQTSRILWGASRYLHSQAQIVGQEQDEGNSVSGTVSGAGYNITHCPRRLDLRSKIGIPPPPLCHRFIALFSHPRASSHPLILDNSWWHNCSQKTEEEHLLKWFGLAALPRSSHVLPQSARTPHQPPEPQPDMASRFSNQWICLLTFTKHFAGKCIGAIEFILVAKGSWAKTDQNGIGGRCSGTVGWLPKKICWLVPSGGLYILPWASTGSS